MTEPNSETTEEVVTEKVAETTEPIVEQIESKPAPQPTNSHFAQNFDLTPILDAVQSLPERTANAVREAMQLNKTVEPTKVENQVQQTSTDSPGKKSIGEWWFG